MPAWGETFSDQDVWKIVAYIKSLSADFPGAISVEP
jgi:mono/diheme cytochrome c family protein